MKKIILYLFILVSFSTSLPRVYAADCEPGFMQQEFSAGQLFCPIRKAFNVIIIIMSLVFVLMVIYGAIKMSLVAGDPKGFKLGLDTWQWAFIGLLLGLGFFAILTILNNTFELGLDFLSPNALFDRLEARLNCLFFSLSIYQDSFIGSCLEYIIE